MSGWFDVFFVFNIQREVIFIKNKVIVRVNNSFKFEASRDDVIQAAEKINPKSGRMNGYFVEINGKEYRMMSIINEMIKMAGGSVSKITTERLLLAGIFKSLGYEVWKNSWLRGSKRILLHEKIRNNLDEYPEEKITFGKHEFTLFATGNILAENEISINDFQREELPNSGPFLITRGNKEEQLVVFTREIDNRKEFVEKLIRAKEKFSELLRTLENYKEPTKDTFSLLIEKFFSREESIYLFILSNMITDFKNSDLFAFNGMRFAFFIYTGREADEFVFNSLKPRWTMLIDSEMMRSDIILEASLKSVPIFKIFKNSKEWWKILIDPRISFADFHKILQKLLGRNDRAHSFIVDNSPIYDENLVVMFFFDQPKDRIVYIIGNPSKEYVELKISVDGIADHDKNIIYPHCIEVSKGIKETNPLAIEETNRRLKGKKGKKPNTTKRSYKPRRTKEEQEEIKEKEKILIKMTSEFCETYLDDEYQVLAEKLIKKMSRKRNVPFLRGRLEIWAAAVIHALGSINFLFDRSTKPYASVSDIANYFKVNKSTVSQKSKKIRDMFKMSYFDEEFSREEIKKLTPPFFW